MAANDVIVLNSILEQNKSNSANSLPDDEYFELFTFEQILKEYELDGDEITSGQIGGGDDGGIDGFFVFVNKININEDTDIEALSKNPEIELFLIQSKQSSSFTESAVEHVIATSKDIFNLEKDISDFEKFYNSILIDKVNIFRQTYLKLASRHPLLKVNYIYASKGDKVNVNPKVQNRANTLKETICQYFTGAKADVEFIGSRELIDASRQEKNYTLKLKFLENPISRSETNYVLLSSLRDYFEFVTYENASLRGYIFASNVRDYQGNNIAVNKDIKQTLESEDKLDFWLLNNGITILASKASIVGKTINLDDVQIVNGLQTTNTIYNYLKDKNLTDSKQEDRAVLIKIVVTTDTEDRDRVIKATNFQTAIPVASLKATERIQADIENYFLSKDWFYDRRKNYYKNMGKPSNKIVSILYLAQAVMAIVLIEPDVARARPSSIIKKDNDYKRVFKSSFKMDMYLFCAKMMKQVDLFISNTIANQGKKKDEKQWFHTSTLRYISFHLAMLIVVKLLGKNDYKLKDVENLIEVDLNSNSEIMNQTLFELIELTNVYVGSRPSVSISTLSKQKEFVKYLLDNVNCSLG
jgi:hypothetical protein